MKSSTKWRDLPERIGFFWLASENATAILQVQLSHKDASNSAWIVVTFGVAVVALVRSQWAFMRSKADLKILSPIPWRTSLLPCQPWVKVLSDAKLFPNLSGSRRISAFKLPAEYTAEFYSNSASEYSHLRSAKYLPRIPGDWAK